MKKWMMGAVMVLLAAGAAQAQDKQQRTPDERAEMRTERMVKELGLNADQTEKVKAINVKYAEKMKSVMEERQAAGAKRDGTMMELNKARMAEYKAVLTPDQYTKLEAQNKAMMEKRKEQRQERRQEGQKKP